MKTLQKGFIITQTAFLILTILSLVMSSLAFTSVQKDFLKSQLVAMLANEVNKTEQSQPVAEIQQNVPESSALLPETITIPEETIPMISIPETPVFQFVPVINYFPHEVRFDIYESFDYCKLTISGTGITSFSNDRWYKSGDGEFKIIGIGFVSPSRDNNTTLIRGNSYNYSIACSKEGYKDNTITGIINIPE